MDQETQFPACFSDLHGFENWRRSTVDKAVTICTDCTPSYQLAMKRQGRCANPNATFRFDEDGAIIGIGRRGHSDETREKMRASALARHQRAREAGNVVGMRTGP